jgi:hypothetical protein
MRPMPMSQRPLNNCIKGVNLTNSNASISNADYRYRNKIGLGPD